MAEEGTNADFTDDIEALSGVGRTLITCKCDFFNETGESIELRQLTHTLDKYKQKLLNAVTVKSGESVHCNDVKSYSGVPVYDHWFLEIRRGGHVYSNDSFYCNLEAKDNGGTVTIRVDASELYIDMPKSSGCKKTMVKRS